MANNRLRLVGIDDDGKIIHECYIAKHLGGAWYTVGDGEKFMNQLDIFFEDCFFDGCGIGITDEFCKYPLKVVYHYND